jgi:hypothetical protein
MPVLEQAAGAKKPAALSIQRHPRERQAIRNCMFRRQIASSRIVVGGVVCANVSGLFVETSSWP